MGGMMVLGVVLALVGLYIQVLVDVTATLLIAGGIIAAVAGGAAAVLGGALGKLWGLPMLALGIAVAIVGVFMSAILDLWIVRWVIEYGGMILLVIGIIMAAIGLIGMFKGDGDRRMEKIIRRELKNM
jgi:hypothetical protein